MGEPLSQSEARQPLKEYLSTVEEDLRNKLDEFETKSEPPTQTEMLDFQFALQNYTLIGQLTASVQKELHEALKAIVSRL